MTTSSCTRFWGRSRTVLVPLLGVFLALALPSCLDDDDDDDPLNLGVGFDATTASLSEGGSLLIPVELSILDGIPLLGEVTVTVTVTGGTAANIADYTVSSTDLTFPVGAAAGTQQMATLDALTDSRVEGGETIVLGLTAMTGGAGFGAIGSQTVTITDTNSCTVRYQSASSSTTNESTVAHPVGVELDLAPGESLDIPIQVVVNDAASGTATAGLDYAVVPPQLLTIPAGSPDGGTVNFNVTVLDDLVIESDETLSLSVITSAPSTVLGSPSTHVMTIVDDDDPLEPFTIEFGGDALSDGDPVDLGTQAVAGGPGLVTTITVRNNGASPITGSLPVLVAGDDREFLVEFGSASALPAPLPLGPGPDSPMIDVGEDIDAGVSLIIDPPALAAIANLPRFEVHDVMLPGGVRVDLDLHRVAAPWTDDAVVAIDGELAPLDPSILNGVSFWRGKVVGDRESRVFLTFSERSSLGWVRTDQVLGGIVYLLPEDRDPAMTGGTDARLIIAEQLPSTGKDLPGAYCATIAVPDNAGELPTVASLPPAPPTGSYTQSGVRLAIETDYQFYQIFGDLVDAQTYVTQMIAAISAVYVDQIHTPLTIAYLGIHIISFDPWATPDIPGTPGEMLTEFRAAWAPSQGGSWPASADLAHFISGANLGGGIAYIGALCDQNFGFGVSAVSGNINWNTFTGLPSSGNWDFIVVSHELGHNFGASHTHSYCPPVDRCQTTCSGAPICEPGTLMSYCHLCGGVANVSLEFDPFIANEMRLGANSAGCAGQFTLGVGESATYELRFDPESSGSKSSTLRFTHNGGGTNPMELNLTGTAP